MSNHPRIRPDRDPMAAGVNLGGAIDLNTVLNRAKYQHSWIMLAKFSVDGDVLNAMAATNAMVRDEIAAGADPANVGTPQVSIPMSGDNLLSLEGPGCGKCGLHWMAEEGFGKLCQVSDADVVGGMVKSSEMPQPQHVGEPAPSAGDSVAVEECPFCGGSGQVFDESLIVVCDECGGSGTVSESGDAPEDTTPSRLLLVK